MQPMSRLKRLAIFFLVLGGIMVTVVSLAKGFGAMKDFPAGFITGIAIVFIFRGVVLLIKDQIALRKEDKEKEKEKEAQAE